MLRGVNVDQISNGVVASGGGGAVLWSVNVNTGAAGSICRIYNNTSAVPADLVAKIDCSAVVSLWYGVYCNKGIFFDLSVGNADLTIGYQ